jgi:hypothetical protein
MRGGATSLGATCASLIPNAIQVGRRRSVSVTPHATRYYCPPASEHDNLRPMMTPDQQLQEELISNIRRMSGEDRIALRAFIKLLDQAHQGYIANFVRQDMQRLLESPPPIPGAENKTPVRSNPLRGKPQP